MAYAKETFNYSIPYISNNEILDGSEEEIAAEIIDNQIRAGILGAGGTRVFQNGTFTAEIVDAFTGRVDLTLSPSTSGLPSVQGIANNGLVEVYDPIVWTDLAPNSLYYIYLQALDSTYVDPTSVNIISSLTKIVQNDYLFLATVDTTNTDGPSQTPPIPVQQPIVDGSPLGKPTGQNLFDFMNSGHDPFGESLTQTILTVLSQFTVILDNNTTSLFQQLSPDAQFPVITIENRSQKPGPGSPPSPPFVKSQPDIYSSVGALLLADMYVPNGFALSDAANTAYIGLATSIIGALNENFKDLQDHINDSTDPHGTHLFQTDLTVSGLLDVVKIHLTPPAPPPPPLPPPPGSPPVPPAPPLPPGQLAYLDIESSGELRIGDSRGGMAWSDPENPYYNGEADSLMGALNELLSSITALEELIGGIVGTTLAGLAPIIFEISPEDLGLPLHFKLTVGHTEDFSTIVVTKESKDSQTGWYYEYQPPVPPPPPAPPSPPLPPVNPYSLPGAIVVPDPLPLPYWVSIPFGGVSGDAQRLLTGQPIRVKYEPQTGDGLFCRIMYSIAVQEYNGEYSDADLSSIVFD